MAAKKLVGSDVGVTPESRLELWHELFHWIEDEQYYMGWARINGDYDAIFEFARHIFHKLRVVKRRCSNDEACNAHVKPALDGLHIADAATELNIAWEDRKSVV